MKRFIIRFFLISLLVFPAVLTGSLHASQSDIFRPGEEWLDSNGVPINAHGGGVLYQGGTYYWYGEHKIEGTAGNRAMVGVHCYSSKDLYNWTDEGIALPVSEKPGSDIEKGCILERPKVIYNEKTGKFVMWFHLELKGEGYGAARSGVAISDTPTGPFTYLHSFRPNAGHWPINTFEAERVIPDPSTLEAVPHGGENFITNGQNILGRDFKGGQMARDMNLFVDDDGTAYHIYASEENSTLHISKLTEDYTEPSGEYVRAFDRRWMEAPAITKRNGIYYIIGSGCTGWRPNEARSGVAKNIFGPWLELRGLLHDGPNPHTGMGPQQTFGGQSTCMFKVQEKEDLYIAMFDVWNPKNPINGRYLWLPIKFVNNDRFYIHWRDSWSLDEFE